MARKPPAALKRGRPRRSTIKRASAKPNSIALAGHSERLIACQKLAFELRMDDWPLVDMAPEIQKRLNLATLPAIPTVSNWITSQYKEMKGELKEMAKHETFKAIENLNKMIGRFMKMAMGGLHVERTKVIGGQVVQVIDEEAFKEQIKAGELVGRHTERLMKILGVVNESEKPADTNVPGGVRAFQLVLMQQYHQHFYDPKFAPNSQPEQGALLELSSGDATIEKLGEPPKRATDQA